MHDLRTSTRRALAAVQILPKKIRSGKKLIEYCASLEKMVKMNARTRDLDIVIYKVERKNRSGQHDELLKQLAKVRESSLNQGKTYARSVEADLKMPVRAKEFSRIDLQKRFEKLSEKYASRIAKRLPTVVNKPEEKKELHMLREDARRLRYILDLAERKPARKQLKMLRSWQDVLGEIHDSDIFIEHFDQAEMSQEDRALVDDETTLRDRNYQIFRKIAKKQFKLAS